MASTAFRPSSSHSSAASLTASTENGVFDFPQPPPRIEVKDSLVSRPSLPALRTAYKSPSAKDLISKRPSVPHKNQVHPPSSVALQQRFRFAPSCQASTDSSFGWEYYSPAVSDANSADTDHSGTSLALSVSSDAETYGPLTPSTPNSGGPGWRPKELNLLRRRERAVSGEGSVPVYQASRSWQTTGAPSNDKPQIVGLGIASAATAMTAATTTPYRTAKPALGRGPATGGSAAATASGSGPKGLLLCSSRPLPSTRRFQSPAARSRENSFGSATGNFEQGKVWTGPIPVLPSTPAFTSLPSDCFELHPSTRSNSITAEEFVARAASRLDVLNYWCGEEDDHRDGLHRDGGLSADWRLAASGGYDPDRPPLSAKSTTTFDHQGLEEEEEDEDQAQGLARLGHSLHEGKPSPRLNSPSSGASPLAPSSSGFSHATSMLSWKRKAPPPRLVFGLSPRSNMYESLPPSASTATPSARDDRGCKTVTARQNTPSPNSVASKGRLRPVSTVAVLTAKEAFEEPLKTAFYDFDSSDTSSDAESQPGSVDPAPVTQGEATATGVARSDPGVDEKAPAIRMGAPSATVHLDDGLSPSAGSVCTDESHVAASEVSIPKRQADAGSMGFLQREQAKGVPKEQAASPQSGGPSESYQVEESFPPMQRPSPVDVDEALQAAEIQDELQHLPGEVPGSTDAWADSKSLTALSTWMRQPETRTASRMSIFAPDATSPTKTTSQSVADICVDPKDTTGRRHAELELTSPPTAVESQSIDSPTDPSYGKLSMAAPVDMAEQRRAKLQKMLETDTERRQAAAHGRDVSGLGPRRKLSLVPPPPQFAINNLLAPSNGTASAPATVNLDQHPATFGPSKAGETSIDNCLSSRWSSGSDSESGSVKSAKRIRRKSSSKSAKKLSLSSRKSSSAAAVAVAASRESTSRSALSSPALSDAPSGFISTSKACLSSQSGSKSPSTGSGGKRALLMSWTGRKRKDSEVWKASSGGLSQASTPGLGPAPPSPVSDHGYPFPRIEAVENAKTQKAGPTEPQKTPHPTPAAAPAASMMTTQQILEQARSNVWPERYGTRTMREPSLREQISLPMYSNDQRAYRAALQPQRLLQGTESIFPASLTAAAPGPALASASTSPWSPLSSTKDILSEINESNRGRSSIQSVHKVLPPLPIQQSEQLPEPRSSISTQSSSQRLKRLADLVATPRNLRHARQASSVAYSAGSAAQVLQGPSIPAGAARLQTDKASSGSELSAKNTPRLRADDLPPVAGVLPLPRGQSSAATAGAEDLDTATSDGPLLPATASALDETPRPIAIRAFRTGRRKVKAKKVRAIGLFDDEWPHRTSFTDVGRAWLREQGTQALEALGDEMAPYVQALSSSGIGWQAGNSKIPREYSDGARGGSDASGSEDTDDYGSSDGGGRSGTGGSSGGGGRRGDPDDGGDGDNSDEDKDEMSDEDDADSDDLSTDDDSEDDYGAAEDDARVARQAGFPGRAAAAAAAAGEDSDSSDDRPLGDMVQDPKALQRALREQERRKHIESTRSALEAGPSRGTSQRTLKKLTAKASRQRAMLHLQDAQLNTNAGESSEASMDLADLTRRLMRVQSGRAGAPPRSPIGEQPASFGPPLASSTDSDRPLGIGAMSRARSINRENVDDAAGPERVKSLWTRPTEAAVPAPSRAQISALKMGAVAPNLPSNAAATLAAAQKAISNAQANPSSANRAHAKAMAAAAIAAMEVLTRPHHRSATLAGPVGGHEPNPLPGLGNPGPPNAGVAGLTRHRTEIRPAGRGEPRRPSNPAASMPAYAMDGSAQHDPDRTAMQQLIIGNRPRARSRAHIGAPNTSSSPPRPELNRLVSPTLKSPGLSSPLTPNSATFAALQQHRATDSTDSELVRDVRSDGAAAAGADENDQAPSTSASIPPRVSSFSAMSSPMAALANLSTDSMPVASHRAQFKVFVINKQRFTTAEIPPTSRARELVLDVIEREQVPLDQSKGGWVVFDCSPGFGIERPLREYEIVHEVADTRANVDTDHFLLKRTELSPYLGIRAVPASSPTLAGYVYVQDKKKWNKRWLELRDHALYHAKSEKGKDEAIICQMSNFDVYLVDTTKVKTPKAHAFALRSQDKISMFEKPDQDYIHYFALSDPAAHRDWVRAIMNARTYILRQERAVLFKPPPIVSPQDGPTASPDSVAMGPSRSGASNGGLSRRNTSRRPGGRGTGNGNAGGGGIGGGVPALPEPTSAAPLLQADASPLISREAFSGPFEKGSLLADIAIKSASDAMRAVPATTYAAHEARRREEAIERQRRLRSEGQPLIDLSKR